MKILIDIYHLPQLNLYKNVLLHLGSENVIITCVNRGKLVDVIKHELPDFELNVIGNYKNHRGLFSMLIRIIFPRIFQLTKLVTKSKISLVISSGYQPNIVAFAKGIPNLIFIDDVRKYFPLAKFVSNELYLPVFYSHYKRVKSFNALKEWAYLSPKYFNPNINVLKEYNIKKKSYLFIREVSTNTVNYNNQEKELILKVSKNISKDIPVLLSLENKNNSHLYPVNWIILKEPISDFHSLMYYSKIIVSSGDSMAREGALLGVPSIYCGCRDMPANKVMIRKGMLYHIDITDLPQFINKRIPNDIKIEEQNKFRKQLESEWDDVTEFIIKTIKKYKRN